ncbi:uncharacterized protein LOC131846329 [Achroia grisella]|uniref:uncharacterized protein LOC131846329 n=1 Tax=Achroia grisella TaxID=688607 RepID=UPI0027D2D46B|nr:uncharacterized protein LOC131846329 [Achroia grisella]
MPRTVKGLNFKHRHAMKLIKEVRERPCLWNSNHEDYNDRLQTFTSWKQIKETLNIPEDALRVKWKNLRDTFKRELRKCNPESPEHYNGKWIFFKYMWFIQEPNDVTNEIPVTDQSLDNDEDFEDYYLIPKPEPIEAEYLEEFANIEEDPVPAKKRKKSDDNEYDLMFLKSLAPYFKDLDPIRKLVLRSKMQDMVLNEIAAQASQKNLYKKS